MVVPGNEQTHHSCWQLNGPASSSQLLTATWALRQLHRGQRLNQFRGSPEVAGPRYLSPAPPSEFPLEAWWARDLGFPTSSDTCTLPVASVTGSLVLQFSPSRQSLPSASHMCLRAESCNRSLFP